MHLYLCVCLCLCALVLVSVFVLCVCRQVCECLVVWAYIRVYVCQCVLLSARSELPVALGVVAEQRSGRRVLW